MKRSSLGAWVIAGFLLAFSVFSPPMANAADTYFPTPGGGGVNGAVGMCLNASNQAVPCTDPTALKTYIDANTASQIHADFGTLNASVSAPVPAGNNFIGTTVPNITPIVSAALESNHVIKGSAGNFYAGYITTGATPGWLLLSNTTTAPAASGAAIAPLACVIAPANATTTLAGTGGAPIVMSTGVTMVFSTSGCLTNTASSTAFFSGQAQ